MTPSYILFVEDPGSRFGREPVEVWHGGQKLSREAALAELDNARRTLAGSADERTDPTKDD